MRVNYVEKGVKMLSELFLHSASLSNLVHPGQKFPKLFLIQNSVAISINLFEKLCETCQELFMLLQLEVQYYLDEIRIKKLPCRLQLLLKLDLIFSGKLCGSQGHDHG